MTIAKDPMVGIGPAGTAVGSPLVLPDRRPLSPGPLVPSDGRQHRPPLSPIALLDLVKQFGARTPPWESPDGEPLKERSYELIDLADDVEIWVIHWPVGGHLQLHDHGGSAGAFWVVGGSLEEHYIVRNRPTVALGHRQHKTASGTAFGGEYVHDVRNGGDGPATTVHAYSPPMPGMTYYRTAGSSLVAERTEYRSDPSWAP